MNVQFRKYIFEWIVCYKYLIEIIYYQDWATVPLSMQTFNIIFWLLKDFSPYLKYHVKSFYYAVI